MKELADPAFVAALATLVTAVAALVKVFRIDNTTKENNVVVKDVQKSTNGALATLREQVDSLRRHIALLEGAGAPPRAPDAPDPPPAPPRGLP